MKKILVTGGSGFLGINLIRYLLAKNIEIINFDLAPFDYADCKDKITSHLADVRDKNKLLEVCKGVDAIVNCAMALPLCKKADILQTGIDGCKNLLEAAKDNNIKRIVHISSTAVYGIPDHHPLLENDKLEGVGDYGYAKIEAEKVCENFREKGLSICILRPKSFIGPERLGVFALLYDWALSGCNFPMIGNGKNLYQLLDVEDLCDAIWSALTLDQKLVNDTFNIGAEKFNTMAEDYQAVLDSAGFGKRVFATPAKPLIWLLRFLEMLNLSPLYKWVYETAALDSFVSIDKAKTILGYKPKFSNKEALLRNFEWYKAHIKDFSGKSGVSHRVPWKQGILSMFKSVAKIIPT